MSIVVIGSINTDLLIQVPHFAQKDETVLGEGSYVISQGGKGANQAVAAAAGGLPVHMLGKVGNDAFGKAALKSLGKAGVQCDYVKRSKKHATGLATIFLDPKARNCITVAPGANARVTPANILAASELIAAADIIMLQLEIPMDACRAAAEIARENNTLVLLDPAPAPLSSQSDALDFLYLVDYLTPNALEAEALTGISADFPEQIAEALLDLGVGNVAITLGSKGSYMANEDTDFYIAARKVEAIDTTGAGDAFSGFLATALARGMQFEQAAEIASAAASLSVTSSGARSDKLSWQRVQKFMQ